MSGDVTSKGDLLRLMPTEAFRLFSLQRDLFDFIDGAAGGWIPTCVEIPPAAAGDKRARDDGGPPKTPQSRFFAAFTEEGVVRYLSAVPVAQQHLYELIREGSQCRLYFDLEREVDFRLPPHAADNFGDEYNAAFAEQLRAAPAICPCTCTTLPNNHPSHVLGLLFRNLVSFLKEEESCAELYRDLIARGTRRLLSRYHLGAIHDGSSLRPEAILHEAALVLQEQSVCLQSIPMCKLEGGGIAGRFAPPFEPTEGKFSLHVVVRFYNGDREVLFPSNVHVGALVSRFVSYLYAQVAGLRGALLQREYGVAGELGSLHSALMFHGMAPSGFPVLQYSKGGAPQVGPLVPLCCIIDTSVYSRNRVFRCIGSSKLGKSSLLVSMRDDGKSYFARWFDSLVCPHTAKGGNPSADDFALWESHVWTSDGDSADLGAALAPRSVVEIVDGVAIPEGRGARRPSNQPRSHRVGTSLPQLSGDLTTFLLLIAAPPGQKTPTPGASVGAVSVLNTTVSFVIRGTRYCHNVGREHKSNGILVCVQLDSCAAYQRCFDPDCNKGFDGAVRRYRSPPISVPDALLSEIGSIVSGLDV